MSRNRPYSFSYPCAFLLIIITPFLINTTYKNSCTSYFNYFLINFSENCYYNNDFELDAPEIIRKYTGSFQQFNVTTEDGFILSLFRIKQDKPLGVILLQPAIGTTSISYLEDGNNSLAIQLWRKGYDVWLSNNRASFYSKNHLKLTDSDEEYWNFSFHEIAMFDFDPQFDLIRKETNGSKVIYLGYSMSSTEGLVYASLNPEKSLEKIQSFILITPSAIMDNISSPLKYLLQIVSPFQKYLGNGKFFSMDLMRVILSNLTPTPFSLKYINPVLFGWTPEETDPSFFPVFLKHYGNDISNKIIFHYAQIMGNPHHFSMYDYGKDENMKLYGSENPPDYPLEKMTTPIYFIYGENDSVTAPADIETLCNDFLPKGIVQDKILVPYLNHIDVLFSKNRYEKIHVNIFNILDKIKKL